MLMPVVLPERVVLPPDPTPGFLVPLRDAAIARGSVHDALAQVTVALGFEHFTYGTSSVPTPTRESRMYVWTNMPEAWVRRYDERAYFEVDPRVSEIVHAATPLVWDRHAFPETRKRQAFFDDAAAHGLRSGVAVAVRDPSRALSAFYLSSGRERIDPAFAAHCAAHEGDMLLLAHYVHAMLTASVVDRALPTPLEGAPLSPRERECLQLAAKGLASPHIAELLGIGERTVHFHFGNVLAKLGAANRRHAVALAIAAGIATP
ncbi:MAG: LuxR family transcriptional regulator [Burkholderiales bacterium]